MLWLDRLKAMSTKKTNKHHVIPVSRGGTIDDDNILVITEKGHHSFHSI